MEGPLPVPRVLRVVQREELWSSLVWAWDPREEQWEAEARLWGSVPLRCPCPLITLLLRGALCMCPWEYCLLSLPLSLGPSGLSTL